MSYYFFFQRNGKESAWELAMADKRSQIVSEVQPAFSTVLDFTGVPEDNDWSKVKYTGPLYFDFDADGDLELVCAQFRNFLGKLHLELGFDVSQARLYASGGKGFHVEIPQQCFIAKPAPGYIWLPYIYREMAQNLMVDTLDLAVYTGKRGRQWRTNNVRRENGNYKVPISLDEAMTCNPETYLELIREPRTDQGVEPPTTNAQFSMLFEKAKDKVVLAMRGRKKRQERANVILDPYKKANRHPPTIRRIMAGENLAPGIGFQHIAMQLAIYAASVDMKLDDFLRECAGLIEKHQGDSWRYGSPERRRIELTRMWEYMGENSFYDFDVGPVVRLLPPGSKAPDLGVLVAETEPLPAEEKAEAAPWDGEGDPPPPDFGGESLVDAHQSFRRGVFHTDEGLFVRVGPDVKSLCRARFTEVTSFFHLLEPEKPVGLEAKLVVGSKKHTVHFDIESFHSSMAMKRVLGAHLIPYQGSDTDTAALFDIMIAKSGGTDSRVYTFPREGLSVVTHPQTRQSVIIYLTLDTYRAAVPEGHPDYFQLKYRPDQAESSYKIDVHHAEEMITEHADALTDLFNFNRADVVADLLGWFVACHFRSAYLTKIQQFPSLQVFGEAGSGKTQTMIMLSHLHWSTTEAIAIRSASGGTEFVLDNLANTSASAPLILDEYKPREMKSKPGRLEKLKDLIKASYVGAELAGRGHLNKGAVNPMSIIKSRAAAPIVFIGEAMEGETAIVERCVTVAMSKTFQTAARRKAFQRLQSNPAPLSAIGRRLVELGPFLNLSKLDVEVRDIFTKLLEASPKKSNGQSQISDRLLYNRAIVIHGLMTLKNVLQSVHGTRFSTTIDGLIADRMVLDEFSREVRAGATSEVSKVVSRMAILSGTVDKPYTLIKGRDYLVDPDRGWTELRVERGYDAYRMYAAAVHETPLFDSLDAFMNALTMYGPVVDQTCADSVLRDEGSNEPVFRFDTARMRDAGVRLFKGS